ncbi:MAG: bifunctional 2-polyprenyl-6-hydroxyphenol methylase/3-demethylubiquinol 3-O-methyltransferase UbiG [Gammaproteobacteria bacterium]|nr:bifunctional 2-polyprenyl-6-hydroxyphenol methylase/3-demethylubiquinol 3-O-methyltransferase UbiG [Gammaproteobacteria bacterium]
MTAPPNVDPAEIAKFEALAHRWWDPDGDFKALHDINPLRVGYLENRCALSGARVVDVGCGGGILTESLAARGADVTGIDVAQGPLAVAQLHAIEAGVEDEIRYLAASPEAFVEEEREAFAVVTCLEMLEHVPDMASTVRALADLVVPGGDVVMSTINRNPKAYALAVVGAEYVLGLLPRGTHDYAKFIRPAELARAVRNAGLELVAIDGMRYNPFTRRCTLTRDVDVNYLLHARKPG